MENGTTAVNPEDYKNRATSSRIVTIVVFVFMAVFFLFLIYKLYDITVSNNVLYAKAAASQQWTLMTYPAERGVIYDCNGNILAASASVDNVYLSPAEIDANGEDRELIARELARILDLDDAEILEKSARRGSWYVTVARKIEADKAAEIRAFKTENHISGVRLETDSKRYYPNGRLACHLLGFVGTDNYGLEGIEARYDKALAGTAGKSLRATNAYGGEMLLRRYGEYRPGLDGCDLVTTIDASIQYYVEKHLRQAVLDYDALNGAGAIAMDVNTGAILAMASLGDYDPNHFLAVSPEAQIAVDDAATKEEAAALLAQAQARQWRNKALSDTYEPGSYVSDRALLRHWRNMASVRRSSISLSVYLRVLTGFPSSSSSSTTPSSIISSRRASVSSVRVW